MADDFENDPLSEAFSSRRMPHGRSRKTTRGGTKSSGRTAFDPLRAVGLYNTEIRATTDPKPVKQTRRKKSQDRPPSPVAETLKLKSRLTIHGFTPDETGLIASLEVGNQLSGMGILAGSRKDVMRIAERLERDESEMGTLQRRITNLSSMDGDEENEEEEDDDDEDDDEPAVPMSPLEIEDEKINRRLRAFEKNSFRNPKFWMRWRARITTRSEVRDETDEDTGDENEDAQRIIERHRNRGKPKFVQNERTETNMAYIIFAGNDCTTFEGTISSEVLNWDDAKITGRKANPHAGECPYEWTDFD